MPNGRVLTTVRRFSDAERLASELVRWVRSDGEEPATDARAAGSCKWVLP